MEVVNDERQRVAMHQQFLHNDKANQFLCKQRGAYRIDTSFLTGPSDKQVTFEEKSAEKE